MNVDEKPRHQKRLPRYNATHEDTTPPIANPGDPSSLHTRRPRRARLRSPPTMPLLPHTSPWGQHENRVPISISPQENLANPYPKTWQKMYPKNYGSQNSASSSFPLILEMYPSNSSVGTGSLFRSLPLVASRRSATSAWCFAAFSCRTLWSSRALRTRFTNVSLGGWNFYQDRKNHPHWKKYPPDEKK